MLLYLSWVLATMALFLPFVFLSAFARNHGAAEVAAAALVSLIGGTSILGRVVLGPIGDRIGVLWLFKATVLLIAVSYAIWLPSSSYLGLSLFAVIVMLGINYGSRVAVVPAVLIDLFGADSLGTTLGVFFTATGLAALIGSTLAGIAGTESGAYQGVVVFALTVGLLGFIAILLVRSRLFGARRSDRR